MSAKALWSAAILVTVLVGGYLGYSLFASTPATQFGKALFLPGKTTQGHYQIELACSACHKPFQGTPQQACVECHGEALKAAEDVHANRKFADPRNAAMLKQVDAVRCATCHREHKPEQVRAMDVTLPDDFCFACHDDVAKERPSHRDFDRKNCASAGCHNYHDDKALYEDFLAAHLHEPDTGPSARVPLRNLAQQNIVAGGPRAPLGENDRKAPAGVQLAPGQLQAWAGTAHARGGINCGDCHQAKTAGGQAGPWQDRLDYKACQSCHQRETKGFLAGKHGMRLAQGLAPMVPGAARLPMKAEAHDKALSCTSCHEAHTFDTQRAAVESCLGCHDDAHSLAYKQSVHYRLWQDEKSGKGEKGSGVSCATCHLPRGTEKYEGRLDVHVEHNQSMNLHPNEKMVRGICMQCHGLGFSLDALADGALVRRNFDGKPAVHVKSIDMAEERVRLKSQRKATQNSSAPENK